MSRLGRTVQCKKCPWKVSTNPHDIPNGYCETKHKNLKETIADGIDVDFSKPLKVFGCHEEEEEMCIGWLHNQLGVGNNIPLRMRMMSCENVKDIKIVGRQHERFEDTLPK